MQEPRVRAETLRHFCQQVFERLEVPEEDAALTADLLVAADLRGIDSHGVARLKRYVDGLRAGVMIANPRVQVIKETLSTALIEGGGGLGQPIGVRAMRLAMDKAQEVGAGFVAVRNSNHYGIAGYYAMMALEQDLIGISMTNASPLVVPTFGREAILGTNPISVAAPAGQERPFVLDMATSVVPRGKLELYHLLGKPIPKGWATDERGLATTDPGLVVRNVRQRSGGGLLPLGGKGEELGGHKGYGLALMVDILSGVLGGTGYADRVHPKGEEGKVKPGNVGHFFGALLIEAFRPLDEFKANMDDLIRRLKGLAKAEGESRIYIHGEKEWEMEEERGKRGIPLHPQVVTMMKEIAEELNLPLILDNPSKGQIIVE